MRYTREDGCRVWLTFGMLTPESLAAIMDEFGSAEAVYDKFLHQGGSFLKAFRAGESSIAALSTHADGSVLHNALVTMRDLQCGIMHIDDPEYPDSLRNIPQPPALLYYRGNLECLMGKCVAVVGSRTVSPQGEVVTRDICRELSRSGVTIVSGLAMGADTAAHEGCIDGGSPTVAVLACGMDVDYPMENAELKERIIRGGGLLLSEYPIGMHGSRYVFQMRNRIISGLSKALVMMESRVRSGSMITVQHALDQGRDVFAYPGVPGSESAEGAHQLLREGAIYFTSARDILEDLGWADDLPAITQQQKKELPKMTPEQHSIYALLGGGEMSFDELADKSGIPPAQLSVILTLMQISGIIRAMPGKSYCRN
ncbi:MAG: DNA-processing protein DprA [Clostridia bacterium]|nr:DNA-processing protein DprA [Clostridia bacterium]